MKKLGIIACMVLGSLALAESAHAGLIADENAKAGTPGWDVKNGGNAQFNGVIDLYPAQWSAKRGETMRLKVRSTTSYSLEVYRLGWYGGVGAREVLNLKDRPADAQPYPGGADPNTGFITAGWKDSVSFPIEGAWLPGLYVAKATQAGGKEAMTYFTVRDDDATPKLPILLVVTAATHQAYNGWPGPERGGKSLYGFNSSGAVPTQSISNQAVKVSLDRPYLVGGGTADLLRYEYPFLRWAEKNGFDVAYCNDDDLERNPDIAKGRRALVISGHWEYVSKGMYDAFENARDTGTNLLFLSGDTLAMQVRYEDSFKTMVGYKEAWANDPYTIAGNDAYRDGKIDEAKANFLKVSRGWKALGYYPSRGIDLRRPGLRITGVQSVGGFRDVTGPWGHLEIASTAPWFFEGTGLKVGDVIKNIMGYEYDSMVEGDTYFDSFRPKGIVKTGKLLRPSDRTEVGSTAYYRHASGADVVSWSAVNFAYVLDDYAAIGWEVSPIDPRMQKLMSNLLTGWSKGAPSPTLPGVETGPVEEDAGPTPENDASVADASVEPTPGAPSPSATVDPVPADGSPSSNGGCSTGRGVPASGALLGLAIALAASKRRRAPTRSARR